MTNLSAYNTRFQPLILSLYVPRTMAVPAPRLLLDRPARAFGLRMTIGMQKKSARPCGRAPSIDSRDVYSIPWLLNHFSIASR